MRESTLVSKSRQMLVSTPVTSLSIPLPSALDVSFGWKFTFGKSHGMVLVMIKPVIRRFPRNGNLKPLLKIIDEELPGKVLVTETVTCPAYAQIMSRGRDQSASIGLTGLVQTSPSNSSSAATAGLSWVRQSTTGSWKAGSEPGCTYTPLLELSVLKRWWRQWSGEPMTSRSGTKPGGLIEDPFASYPPPWAPLDEDGEEVEDEEVSLSKPIT
jgi:hypothetical protein